jgi:hypothetical protein
MASVPGIQLSSLSTSPPQLRPENSPSTETVAVLLSPFFDDGERGRVCDHTGMTSPVICSHCGAYACSSNQSVSVNTWKCVFCDQHTLSVHPFNCAPASAEFSEFESRDVSFATLTHVTDSVLHLFAIDSSLFGDASFKVQFTKTVSLFPATAKVAVLVLDDVIRLVRLGEQSLTPLALDVIPTSSISSLAFRPLKVLPDALYVSTAEFLQAHMASVLASLSALLAGPSTRPSKHPQHSTLHLQPPIYSLNTVVAVANQLRSQREREVADASTVKVLLALQRDFRLKEHKDKSRFSACKLYSEWGRKALRDRCTFYALQLGLAARHAAALETFASSSGGVFVSSELAVDAPLQALVEQMFISSTTGLGPSEVATVSLRVSSGLEVERITASLLSTSELVSWQKHRAKSAARKQGTSINATDTSRTKELELYTEDALYLNPQHFATSWQEQQSRATAGSVKSDSDQSTAFRQATIRAREAVALCGLTAREGRETTLVFSVRRVDETTAVDVVRKASSSAAGLWSRLKAFPANVFQVDSSRPETSNSNLAQSSNPSMTKQSPASLVDRNNDCGVDFVQVISRHSRWAVDTIRRVEHVYITRVWTLRIQRQSSIAPVLRELDVDLWALGAIRGVVADFHDDIELAFDGPRPHQCTEKDYEKYKELRVRTRHLIDSWFTRLTTEWKSSPTMLLALARYVYHTMEGCLLDGPSAVSCLMGFILRNVHLFNCLCFRVIKNHLS